MKLGTTAYYDFITFSPSTGETIDADTTPTVEVFENDNDVPVLIFDAVKRVSKTGNYRVRVEAITPTYEVNKSYSIVASVIVEGVSSKVVVRTLFIEDAMSKLTDVATRVTAPAPESFVPDHADPPTPVPSLDELFAVGHEFSDIYISTWDKENNVWRDVTNVPPAFAIEVETAYTAIEEYNALKSAWDFDYTIQKDIQWRAYYAQKLLDETE